MIVHTPCVILDRRTHRYAAEVVAVDISPRAVRFVELNAALARSYEAHRLLSGVDFSRDTADEAVEPCGQNPRFQLHRDSGTPVLVATCERCNFCQPVL